MNKKHSFPSIGVIFHPTFPPETLADFAKKAELAGFDELWLWDDCFLPGAFTSSAIALSATQELKVGIGLIPATTYHPLFTAMEITTLSRTFPGRILPGLGTGVPSWMKQIGAAPKSYLSSLNETIITVRKLLNGEKVTTHTDNIHLENVQMQMTPNEQPPILIGAKREKVLQMAGRISDGTILTAMSSPAYIRWAIQHIRTGMAETGRTEHKLVVYVSAKVNPDGAMARAAVRRAFADRLPWVDAQLDALGITEEVDALIKKYGAEGIAEKIPDAWLDSLSAAGTPEQVMNHLNGLIETGVDSIVFQPLNGDPECLDEYIQYLMPLLKPQTKLILREMLNRLLRGGDQGVG